jgi:N-carbamoylputrescine amidase
MKLAVCEAPAGMVPGDTGWKRLIECAKKLRADILLLNEMPFGQWVSAGPEPNGDQLAECHKLHDAGLEHLAELGARAVLGTRPTFERQRSVNMAFSWTRESGFRAVHTKQFFPDEEGYYEARWFERGDLRFQQAELQGLQVGFLTCTDVMFPEWARYYGRRGTHLIAVPRATPRPSLERWKTVMAASAIISGCYVASSNRNGVDSHGQEFGGRGWIFGPAGDLIAETSSKQPVVAAEIEVSLVEQAKVGYPSYVRELPVEEMVGILKQQQGR